MLIYRRQTSFHPLLLVLASLIMARGLIGPVRAGHPAAASQPDRVRAQLQDMTLEEKVGQLFLITIYSTTLDAADRSLIATIHPGGVVLFPHNLLTPGQITELTNRLQTYAQDTGPDVPLLIAVDQEGGRVTRLDDGFTFFPSVLMLGATANHDTAMQVGYAMGQEMAAVGINMNLAPVADLQTPAQARNPGNVLYRRTLSADPALTGRLAGALIVGMRGAGVIGVLKHFPGHGAATLDSHTGLPEVSLSRAEVEQTALAAFETAISYGSAPAVMFGHLYYPALDSIRRPASLSPVVMNVLRNDLAFDGVAISDAMDMGAISDDYTMSGAIIESINAGMDLIAFGPHVSAGDQQVVYAAVLRAVQTGQIPLARLDEAVERALLLRMQYGLLNWSPLDVDDTAERLHLDDHQVVLNQLAQDAVTALDNPRGLLPIDPAAQRTALIYPAEYAGIQSECARYDPDLTAVATGYNPSGADLANAARAAEQADVVIVFVEDLAQNNEQYQLAWAVPPEKTVAVLMRSPYDWVDLPVPLDTVLLTYDSTPATFAAACRVLYGLEPARGRLPVPVGPYEVGAGVPVIEETRAGDP
ncbi:MAG: glycoside hydrolase family 3 protein [Anaerolineae bacterium]|nr:glycoside hydrolase family 3 protein [Anaerolineae bacterium]